jgi:hypothetical protein
MRRSVDRLEETEKQGVRALRRWLLGLLASQVVLGLAAFIVVWGLGGGGLGTSLFPTLHVLAGGSLLLACVASSMRIRRLFPDSNARTSLEVRAPGLEVAR